MDNPNVLLWDVKNEPDHPANLDGKSDDWKCCPEKRAKITDWLRRMCEAVRRQDKNHPVGVGIRWYANVGDTVAFVDVAMFHSYWHNIADVEIPTVKQATSGRPIPIIVEEYGLPTNPNPCDRDGVMVTDFSESNQRAFLDEHLKAFAQHQIAGGLQWMTFDAAKYTSNPKESFEKYFGLWRYDYSLKPASELYRDAFKVSAFPH
jgi:hypothetical protein